MKHSSPEGRPLFDLVFFLVIGVGLLGVAIALHPQLLGHRLPAEDRVDFVSLTYQALELSRHPEDPALRRQYARQLAQIGRYDDASRVAAPLWDSALSDLATFELLINIELEHTRAATGRLRLERARYVLGKLERSLDLPFSSEHRARFASIARELGDRMLEARLVEGLDDVDLVERLERSARSIAEAGHFDEAATRWLRIAELVLEQRANAPPTLSAGELSIDGGR